jgi:hypothetical protein
MGVLESGSVIGLGDRVWFNGSAHTVVALSGTAVRVIAESGVGTVILLSQLLSVPDFALLDAHPLPALTALGFFAAVPQRAAEWWERQVIEVETGVAPASPPGTQPRPEYDPQRRPLHAQEKAKSLELTAAGFPTAARTVQRMRLRYRQQGLAGLLDQRTLRESTPFGDADLGVVRAMQAAILAETNASTGTKSRLQKRVKEVLDADYGKDAVPFPSKMFMIRGTPPRMKTRPVRCLGVLHTCYFHASRYDGGAPHAASLPHGTSGSRPRTRSPCRRD